MKDSEVENHPHTQEVLSKIWRALDALNPLIVLKDIWFVDVVDNQTEDPNDNGSVLVSLEVGIWIDYKKE